MPPKRKTQKTGKGKPSSFVDGFSTEEMSKAQLEENIICLREELGKVQEERSYFQLERDKIQASWEIFKRNLEETKAELRNSQRESEETKERHQVEITVYKQKLRHVLAEHHNTISKMKMDSAATTFLIQNQHTNPELSLRWEKHNLQTDHRDCSLHSDTVISELKLKHQVELMELAKDLDKRFRETEEMHHQKMHSVIQAERKKRTTEVFALEDKMQRLVVTLMEENGRALREAEEYHSSVQVRLVEEQKLVKKELEEVKQQRSQALKELSAARRENRHLKKSLHEAQQQLPDLRNQLEDQSEAKTTIAMSRARMKVTEKELRDLKVEHEWLLQAFEKVQQERDELLKKQTEAILDIQKKRDLRESLLEMKLAALMETLEKKEAQLLAALSSTNIDQLLGSSATNKGTAHEMFESKQATINTLQFGLAQAREEYEDQLQVGKQELEALSDSV